MLAATGTLARTPLPVPVRPDRLAVEVVTDEAAFIRMADAWNETADRAAVPHPFLRHEWVRAWWDAFRTPGARLHILVVREGGRIAAIAPFMRDTSSMYGIPTRRVRFLANDHTPRTDILVAGDHEATLRAVWTALRRDRERWDVLQLAQLPRDSATARFLSDLAARDGYRTGIWRSGDSPYLRLAGTWEEYVGSLPAKFRSNLRNRMGRLTNIGELSLEVLTDRAAIEAAVADAWRLESSGWKRDEGTAITCDPAVQAFYTGLIARGTAAGWLQLLFLKVGNRRVATSYGACFNRRLFLFKTGYDPAFATGAPFKVLTWLAIRDAYAAGLAELDFLGDAEPWKLEWTATSRGHDWLFVFGPTVRARLLHSAKFQWLPELKKWRA